ncbi:DUF4276 family protein [Pseudomonas asplenii]|uniref:DUF4276 family protein n=1 Tax=Pseudomonas asplenii TaxID=53407 RepID=UPI0003600034|nr:DUF4276 family protein [Pseudomonas fuscovaginae]
MTRLILLVEGQTEEAFVRELLVPHYARLGIYLTAIIVSTSPGYKGGVVSYAKVRPQLIRLCRQDRSAYVSTLFDLYALPNDFPGKNAPEFPTKGSGAQKAAFLEAQLALDINERNFIPHLLVHEFEALLFAGVEQFAQWADDVTVSALSAVMTTYTTPEDINDSPSTAPSKRVLKVMPGYQKTFHGPLIACDIGLDVIRAACPHFHAWLGRLEAI